jgi:hypothetical protein
MPYDPNNKNHLRDNNKVKQVGQYSWEVRNDKAYARRRYFENNKNPDKKQWSAKTMASSSDMDAVNKAIKSEIKYD